LKSSRANTAITPAGPRITLAESTALAWISASLPGVSWHGVLLAAQARYGLGCSRAALSALVVKSPWVSASVQMSSSEERRREYRYSPYQWKDRSALILLLGLRD